MLDSLQLTSLADMVSKEGLHKPALAYAHPLLISNNSRNTKLKGAPHTSISCMLLAASSNSLLPTLRYTSESSISTWTIMIN